MKTWKEVLTLGGDYLAGHGVPNPEEAAELLMARLLRCSRGDLPPYFEQVAEEKYLQAMRRGMGRLVQGEPVQYVLGEWDFRYLTLTCDKRALIPRPETEELVSRVLKSDVAKRDKPFVVDAGTGSGCIILSLAKEMKDGIFLGIDISPDAISLARENAVRTGLADKVKFAVADGLDDFDEPESVDIIVSNPPYIPTADCAALDSRVRDWEPMNALDGGAGGLDFYERFIADAFNILKPGGGIFFEIGDGQGEALRKLLFDSGFDDIRIEKDYAGHDRYAYAVLPESF